MAIFSSFIDEGMTIVAGSFPASGRGDFAFTLRSCIDEYIWGIYVNVVTFAFFHLLSEKCIVTHSDFSFEFEVDSNKLNLLEFEESLSILVQMR